MRKISTSVLLLVLMVSIVPSTNIVAQERKQHKPTADVQAEMLRARQSLQTAKDELVHAGSEWGGHRQTAIEHVDAALAEVAKAEQWARQHKDIR